MRYLSFMSAFLASTLLFIGCEKKPPPPPTDGPNPRYEFVMGVRALEKPDRKGAYDYETAYKRFVDATQLDPKFVEAHHNAGWVAEQMGNLGAAANHYQQAYQNQPTQENLFAFTDILRMDKKSADAVPHLKAFSDKNPQNKEVLYSLVESYTEAELYEEAHKSIENILLYAPKDVKAYRLLSRNFHAKGDYKMSLLCAEKADEIAKGDPGILNNMGVTYLEMKNEPAAIDSFLTALSKDESHLEANLNLGFLSLASGNYNLAKEKFEAARKKYPQNVDVSVGLAVALRGLGDIDGAQKIYKKLLKEKPNAQIIYFNAATFYEKYRKKYKDAANVLEEYKSRNPEDPAVDERIARVQESQRIEEERKKEEERKRKEEALRKKRQKEEFATLKKEYAVAEADYKAIKEANCAEAEEKLMELEMYLEQVKELIDTNDIETAGDATPFVREAQAGLDELKPLCGLGGEAPEEINPEDVQEDAPTEEGTPEENSPKEGTPEDTPPEEAPPE